MKRKMKVVLLTALITMLLAACSNKEDNESSSTNTAKNDTENNIEIETENYSSVEIETEDTEVESEDMENMDTEIEETENNLEISSEANTESNNSEVEMENKVEETKPSWTVADMNKTMYAKSSVNVRKGPDTDYDKLGSLSKNKEVKVTGKCNEHNWYRIEYDGTEGYVSANYLVDEKVKEPTNNKNNNNTSNSNTNNQGNNNSNTNDGNGSSNTNNNVNDEETASKEESTPSTPEPAYGHTVVQQKTPSTEWAYLGIASEFIYEDGWWCLAIRQKTLSVDAIDNDKAFEIVESVYSYPTEPGYEGQVIENTNIWVYLGTGRR